MHYCAIQFVANKAAAGKRGFSSVTETVLSLCVWYCKIVYYFEKCNEPLICLQSPSFDDGTDFSSLNLFIGIIIFVVWIDLFTFASFALYIVPCHDKYLYFLLLVFFSSWFIVWKESVRKEFFRFFYLNIAVYVFTCISLVLISPSQTNTFFLLWFLSKYTRKKKSQKKGGRSHDAHCRRFTSEWLLVFAQWTANEMH